MADSEVASSQTQAGISDRGASHPHRRGRAGRGRGDRGRGDRGHGGHRDGRSATPQNQGASATATDSRPDGASGEGNASFPRRGRGRGRGRGGLRATGRGAASRGAPVPVHVPGTRRTFGGHLTTETEESDGSAPALSADAPEFVPGQPVKQGRPAPKQQKLQFPMGPKSTAADLPTRIHEDIIHGQYECVICTSEVLRTSRVWSCSICWTVVHLPCVKKWYTNQIRKDDDHQSWRCPGCNLPMTEEPSTYHCWCGKDISPSNVPGLPPHSCGQTCSKPRATCPHPCSLECHAGPCPPCGLMGPVQSCFCGKHEIKKRCTETDYGKGWSCQEVCGDLLPCGDHYCSRPCHSGLCGSCEIPIASRCYCGRVEKEIPCDRRDDALQSFNYGQVKATETDDISEGAWFEGSFECGALCQRKYDCGDHECEKTCHPQDEDAAHCPFSPDLVLSCPCGKTPLEELLDEPRRSCKDKIPHCTKTCGKTLPCGHECDDTCHTGPCRSCYQKMDISCRCGRTVSQTLCHQGQIAEPMCMRVCQAQLNCARHQCGERCCPGEKKAAERQAARRKHKLQNADDVEAEHICIRICGRVLKCGTHVCQQICHKGPCPTCLEAVFDEISCTCGRTVLQPPQPCGTRPPECRFDCTHPRPCGHPQVQHNCHPEDLPCPKCPFLVEKSCICGKQRLKNQPCWFEEVRCGLPCGKKLKCGTHTCKKPCHRAGQCEDAEISGSHCAQACGKTRKSCDHACQDTCHAPFPCKEDKPCQSKTFITCDCQHRKQEVRCLATKLNSSPKRDTLKCDDECLRLQRNQRLAAALNIDPETHSDDHVPYANETLKLFRDNVTWAQTQEREFRVFASDTAEKRIRFKPMPPHQRAFLHALAEDYGFDSESQDPEPHRHVCVFKTPRFVSAPRKTLAQCVKIRSTQAAEPPRSAAGPAPANEPYNALLLSSPRFGLTIKEVETALAPDLATYNALSFTTSFLPSDEIVIRAVPNTSWGSTASAVETSLSSLKPAVARTVARDGLASAVILCHADPSLNILRREGSAGAGAGGWSAVVGRAAQKRLPVQPQAETRVASGFVSLKREPKKLVREESVEEDWEAAAEKLDE